MHHLQGNAIPAGRAISWATVTKFCVIEGFPIFPRSVLLSQISLHFPTNFPQLLVAKLLMKSWCFFYPSGLSLCLSVDHFGLVSEAFARILTSHGIATANRPYRMPRNFVVHQKEKVEDEEKTELIYRVHCKKCFSSYVGERQEVRSEDQGTQERSRLFHSWYTDPSLHGKVE